MIHDMDLSEPFTVRTGVIQGCLLSPMIFFIIIDWVMKKTLDRPREIQWTLTSQLEDLDYADVISPLSHTSNQIQMKTTRLQDKARTTGLEIKVDKTKCLRINPGNTQSIDIGGQIIEDVDTFTYLGSIVSKT